MATTIDELQTSIRQAVGAGFRGRLLDRGEARSMIWRDGALPPGSPGFAPSLSYDLMSYAYALLGMGLRLREAGGDETIARLAFEHAAMALESMLLRGPRQDAANSFHYVVAASAYHLARFSARAFSMLTHGQRDASFSPIERSLYNLILRDLSALEQDIIAWRVGGPGTDTSIAERLQASFNEAPAAGAPAPEDGSYVADALATAVIDNFLAGMGLFLFALERGDPQFVVQARERLGIGLSVCAEVNLLPQWWAYRLTINMLDDLWSSSFHARLPFRPNEPDSEPWSDLRKRFVSVLHRRPRAEVDLWPSQLDAAAKAILEDEALVVSLPTSAGKTRIAELCILRCLAAGKRVVFITPLRALSAQTETSLHRTFGPLGKTISTLYGSIGTSDFETNALGTRHIVVGTPEKLDFALRNDPSLLDDVGLVILDEGHMIGLGEREVRYEVQIQRLLKRADADERRIVCLSAILPDNDQLDDFVAWLSSDGQNSLIKSAWRPTRLRFGEVTWRRNNDPLENHARLDIHVANENPFVEHFFQVRKPTAGRRQKPFPSDHRELVLATTWQLTGDGQTVLIYCPERRSVEPYATAIVGLHKYGLITSVLGDNADKIAVALAIGTEWLGADHDILKCLKLGVAIHHGALPTPFRKEVEKLLRDGVLKVTVSSPTLAQGLNLSATTVVMHGIIRNKNLIEQSEFRNVIGRAGRAFVDVDGLVLLPFFEPHSLRAAQWNGLKAGDRGREMESGLVRLVVTLLQRMQQSLRVPMDQLVEYVMNNAEPWSFPAVAGETAQQEDIERRDWERYLTSLDTAILSLVGDSDIPDDAVETKLDEILASSLWERRLARRDEARQAAYRKTLVSRAKYLWSRSNSTQRRSYFLAGVGYETGKRLDQVAPQANQLLINVNGAVLLEETEDAITAFTALTELLFAISPFTPETRPGGWRDVLRAWLLGETIADLAETDSDVLRFVEEALIYRLPWAMEAVRVRGLSSGDTFADGTSLDDYELGVAVPALETGTLNRSAAILMQAGFTSRLAAIKAVADTGATFENAASLRTWLLSDNVAERSQAADWPTEASHEAWIAFQSGYEPQDRSEWKSWTYSDHAQWTSAIRIPAAGSPVRIVTARNGGGSQILSPDHELLGTLANSLHPGRKGLLVASVNADRARIDMAYVGPADLIPNQLT
ncbi:DEAD/DEAH box helicase [Bradyrhizobium liaoningense]|uniref:DEAD/DEAH box helicase n=1 Tax=Bradyrhizobium liaoningense TaxID=43992 RepID=UPI001BAD7242|nr:DEAD/DEAH box helicase [Bradyrhizobium liaoningense]MBR1033589.1 DEAD/DEAH box helicase [Bradyrhizobium liaoningense]